jgi:hypothetical protein
LAHNYRIKISAFTIVLLSLFFLKTEDTVAQANYSAEVGTLLSSSSQTPFWLQSNKHGMYSANGSQVYSRFQYSQRFRDVSFFDLEIGGDLIARAGSDPSAFLNRGYLKMEAFGFELAAGRFFNTSPTSNDQIGMGSLGVSRNASPVPQVRFGSADWLSVPFTNGFFEVKGHLTHGWLGSNRYTEKVLLHEKTGHIKIGGSLPVNVYGGIAHYALWGGNSPDVGDIPTRFSDFADVFLAKGGGEGTPGIDQAFILGDHKGAIDFGALFDLKTANVTVYRQFPLETKDNLKLKSLQDALTGISFQFSEDSPLPFTQFVYEYLYTKYQDGPRRPNILDDGFNCAENPGVCRDDFRGNENYYNHELYRTGWAYQNRSIGNPLFTLNDTSTGFLNNRIVGHHVGFESQVGNAVVTAKGTYSRNYGVRCDNRHPNLGERELFGIQCENRVETVGGKRLDQWSLQTGAELPLSLYSEGLTTLIIELALDNGAMAGSQIGGLVGLRWQPN